MNLYPMKFSPIFKTKIWGGDKLKNILNKKTELLSNVGESWELSAVPNDLSVISNGEYAGLNIEEAINRFKEQLLGKRVYKQFGNKFPLLIKFIDANDYLSVQVHPDDKLAKARHNSFGKTEMWYVVEAEKDAELIIGFNEKLTKEQYIEHVNNATVKSVLNFEKVQSGDVFHLPAGRVHATGSGILFAEIQQTSDITYRIYDWDRKDDNGKERELHTELAVDAIDFNLCDSYKTNYSKNIDVENSVVRCKYYTTDFFKLTKKKVFNYSNIDSFIVLLGTEGEAEISYSDTKESLFLKKGETLLIPAELKELVITPLGANFDFLQVHIDS